MGLIGFPAIINLAEGVSEIRASLDVWYYTPMQITMWYWKWFESKCNTLEVINRSSVWVKSWEEPLSVTNVSTGWAKVNFRVNEFILKMISARPVETSKFRPSHDFIHLPGRSDFMKLKSPCNAIRKRKEDNFHIYMFEHITRARGTISYLLSAGHESVLSLLLKKKFKEKWLWEHAAQRKCWEVRWKSLAIEIVP